MPRASVWLIRTALIHLLSGAVLGAAYLSVKAIGWPVFALSHRPVHVEQMLIGWMVQLVIGVAYWILPRGAGQNLASDRAIWVVYALLNAGVLASALGGDPRLPAGLVAAGKACEAIAVLMFGLHAWNRQRAYRTGARQLLL